MNEKKDDFGCSSSYSREATSTNHFGKGENCRKITVDCEPVVNPRYFHDHGGSWYDVNPEIEGAAVLSLEKPIKQSFKGEHANNYDVQVP